MRSNVSSGGSGSSSNDPAVSGAAALAAGNVTDGWYWIKTSRMPNARRVYCNMTDAGGGWMLVSYNGLKQTAATTALRGQFYPAGWSNGEGTLSGQFAIDVMDVWYNNNSNQCSNLLRLGFTSCNAIPTIANSYIGHMCTYTTNANVFSTMGSGVQGTGILNPSAVLMATRWSSVKGYTSLSTSFTNAPSDWMYNSGAGFYWLPVLPLGQSNTIRSGSGSDIGGWMLTTNKDTWGLSNVASNSSSAGSAFPGNTVAVFVK